MLEQFDRVISKWNLRAKTYLQTWIESIFWDEGMHRWHVRSNHSDHFIAQFVVMATGTWHAPKLRNIPSIEEFRGHQFHSGRWNYTITGGDPSGNMTKAC